uniref:Uncharacterized protein n=1 Tax=Rhizophora mucronata TaxID=61149 RepID=A0A2P2LF34_RHIMU
MFSAANSCTRKKKDKGRNKNPRNSNGTFPSFIIFVSLTLLSIFLLLLHSFHIVFASENRSEVEL